MVVIDEDDAPDHEGSWSGLLFPHTSCNVLVTALPPPSPLPQSIEQKEESKVNDAQVLMAKCYREMIELELAKICEDVLDVFQQCMVYRQSGHVCPLGDGAGDVLPGVGAQGDR